MKKSVIIFLVILLVIAGFLVVMQRQKGQETTEIKASGTIETTETQVGSRLGGRIVTVARKEGDALEKGDLLVQFDPYQLPGQKVQLEAQLAQAQAQLEKLRNGSRPEEVRSAKAAYNEAQARYQETLAGPRSEDIQQAEARRSLTEADLANAKANYDRYKKLLDRQVISQQEYDSVETTYKAAQSRYQEAREAEQELKAGNRREDIAAAQARSQQQLAQYQLVQSGTRYEDIAAQQAMVDTIRGQLEELNATIKELTVTSPCQCKIDDMDLRPGQLIMPNQTLANLVDLNDIWVKVYIPEERFGQVSLGDVVDVTVDPFPGKVFKGKVIQIASQAEFTPRNVQTEEGRKYQVFAIKVSLTGASDDLRPGMPADVTFKARRPTVKKAWM